jgi:hypothetical protein
MENFGLSRLYEKPRLKIEKQRSFDDRSLSELSIGGRSGFNKSARNLFEPRPMVADAWESLRKSQVYYKGEPVGTVAAVDHQAEEVLNYDQVNSLISTEIQCSHFVI